MKVATVPNLICLLRIALTVPIVMLLAEGRYGQTLVLFAIAAVSDMLDGFLAKTFGWTCELGKILDPLADKLLLVSVFITLAVIGLVPVWLAAVAVLRDVVIGFGAGVYKLLFGPVEGVPTVPSKINTLVQLAFVIAVVWQAAFRDLPDWLILGLGACVLVTTVVSGVDYVRPTSARRSPSAAAAAPCRRPVRQLPLGSSSAFRCASRPFSGQRMPRRVEALRRAGGRRIAHAGVDLRPSRQRQEPPAAGGLR